MRWSLAILFLSACLALGFDPTPLYPREPFPTNARLSTVIHANGRFLAISDTTPAPPFSPSIIRQSTDGATWTNSVMPYTSFAIGVSDVVYANGLYVAVGGMDLGAIETSPDGTNWNAQFVGGALNGLTYGPEGFVAVGAAYLMGRAWIETSLDGLVWTNRESGLTNDAVYYRYLNAVAYGNGRYVAVGSSGAMVYSTNAVDWTRIGTARASYDLTDILFTNGVFLAVGTSGTVLLSDVSGVFSPIATGFADHLYCVTYANGTYVAGGAGGVLAISTNGEAWSKVPSGTTAALFDVCYGAGTFVFVGSSGTILQSRDLLHPTLQLSSVSGDLKITASPSEFDRPYRIEGSTVVRFTNPTTLFTYSNSHTNIVIHDTQTQAARFYRVVGP